ncbi:GWT1-domain-containing protein [Halteromyces radiatus]|uniref:GWT1-domain-containing protein n=1 Tax=Halteromyces radiatus TaxID=101107 RepID=UPI0022209DDF|nr:GWT1-domain-containing protein [Halteromyces radiatus]KAI8096335.1 GWT1-domain-containing protein [Halteromyces radiatus]
MSTTLTYKEEKEAWVSNCTGGSLFEVNFIASSCVVSHVLWLALVKSKMINVDTFTAQFLIYVIPAILIQTILADQVIQVLLGMLCLALNVIYRSENYREITSLQQRLDHSMVAKEKKKEDKKSSSSSSSSSLSSYKTYLTVYRAATMILTCIAILAVDFPVFPRRFAKVETFGTSLMDVGVGSFVFSSGVVASRAYSQQNAQQTLLHRMTNACRSCLPLLLLGGIRLLLTRSVDYQLHNSEYGLHWNFFMTLGLLPPFVTLITSLKNKVPFSYLGWGIVIGYQYLLHQQGLQTWVLEAPRVDLLSANKEGICSFMGYLAIFLFGLDVGCAVFDLSPSKQLPIISSSSSSSVAIQLTVKSILYWIIFGTWLFFTQNDSSSQVSRRLANLPYVIWVISFNLTLLTLLIWVEQWMNVKNKGPQLLNDINLNGLATFLLANLMTGAVNLMMKTLYASSLTSMMILCIYMMVTSIIPWLLRIYQIRIKL